MSSHESRSGVLSLQRGKGWRLAGLGTSLHYGDVAREGKGQGVFGVRVWLGRGMGSMCG